MDGWTEAWMDGRMDGWMEGERKVSDDSSGSNRENYVTMMDRTEGHEEHLASLCFPDPSQNCAELFVQ